MTNEEILKQQKIVKYIPYFIKAMDAAREDEAIRFAEWRFKVGYSPCACRFGVGWIHHDDGQKPFYEATFFTTKELYQLYKKQNP